MDPSSQSNHTTSTSEEYSEVPLKIRIMLSHTHLQRLAEQARVDILHIKGYIFGEDTYPKNRTSTDVDILVRPSHLDLFIKSIKTAGWEILTTFESGSDYHHAMTIYHPTWGLADIHREFPGLGQDAALTFERLWKQRRMKVIANYPCATTSLVDSRVIVYIHAARSSSELKPDVEYLNSHITEEERTTIQSRVVELDAELAYAAAIGTIDDYSERRDYLLWKTASEQSSNLARWYARVKVAPGAKSKAKTLLAILRVNRDHLAMELGHRPSQQEIRAKFISRFLKITPPLLRRK